MEIPTRSTVWSKKAERHSDSNSFSFSTNFPERNVLFISKFFHAPRGFKACSEVHRNEQPNLEPFDELTATKGIAVADTSIYGEHHHIETVGNLKDVLQLAKKLLLVSFYFFSLTISGLLAIVSLKLCCN